MVDAIATVDVTGEHRAVAIMNRHPSEPVRCTIELETRLIDGTCRATRLTADSPDAFNEIHYRRRLVPRSPEVTFDHGTISLPPHSLVIVDLPVAK